MPDGPSPRRTSTSTCLASTRGRGYLLHDICRGRGLELDQRGLAEWPKLPPGCLGSSYENGGSLSPTGEDHLFSFGALIFWNPAERCRGSAPGPSLQVQRAEGCSMNSIPCRPPTNRQTDVTKAYLRKVTKRLLWSISTFHLLAEGEIPPLPGSLS